MTTRGFWQSWGVIVIGVVTSILGAPTCTDLTVTDLLLRPVAWRAQRPLTFHNNHSMTCADMRVTADESLLARMNEIGGDVTTGFSEVQATSLTIKGGSAADGTLVGIGTLILNTRVQLIQLENICAEDWMTNHYQLLLLGLLHTTALTAAEACCACGT